MNDIKQDVEENRKNFIRGCFLNERHIGQRTVGANCDALTRDDSRFGFCFAIRQFSYYDICTDSLTDGSGFATFDGSIAADLFSALM